MEIARLEVSMQQHLERMQETAKVNYVQYGKLTKSKKKKPQSNAGATAQGAGSHKETGGHRGPRPSGKPNKRPPLLPDTCYRCGKGETPKRHRTARLWTPLAEGVERKGHYEKVCLQGKCSAHSLETTTGFQTGGPQPMNPYISMMRDSQSTLTWSVVPPCKTKHLIKFPVALEPTALRRKGTNADSSPSTSTPSVLLKADTGADVNLMNRQTFNQPFGGNQGDAFKTYTHQDGKTMGIQQ